jgi:hypothetical protein
MDSTYNESVNARLAHFLRKEAAEKEVPRRRQLRRRMRRRKTSRCCHREAAMMTAPSAPSDFLESCVG